MINSQFWNNYSSDECLYTLNTTRVCGKDSIETARKITRIGYTHSRPGSIILINKNEIFDGIAAASLIHHPRNAPILLIEPHFLDQETLFEIQRLNPTGYRGIQLLLVGNISNSVRMYLNSLGFSTSSIKGRNHYETACQVFSEVLSDDKDIKNVLIVSGEDYRYGVAASYWSAHMGDPILFVAKNNIPRCTLDSLKKLQSINIYILGSADIISTSVEQTLSSLPNLNSIDRISGNSFYEVAVNFAKYKSPSGDFGWNKTSRDGHAFTFASINNPAAIIPGSFFAHMGKHTPLLLIEKNAIPNVVSEYIEQIKPLPKTKPHPPFMHGWIIGCLDDISYPAQVSLETLLSVDHH
jgi:putative cell wall-binding protein